MRGIRTMLCVSAIVVVVSSCGGSGYSQDELDAAVDRAVDRALESQTTTSDAQPSDNPPSTQAASTSSTQATPSTSTTTTSPSDQIEGTVNVAWWVDPPSAEKTETSCADMKGSYQVEIRDGAEAVASVAPLTGGHLLSNELTPKWQAIECQFVYTSSVSQLPVYIITLSSLSGERLATVSANGERVRQDGGPGFLVTFTCVAYPCETRGFGGYPQAGSDADTASTTTTVFEPVDADALDLSGSEAICSRSEAGSTIAAVTFVLSNTGTAAFEIYQVAVFPYGPFGHAFIEPYDWWPLPTLAAGEAVQHSAEFDLGPEWNETKIEVFVDSAAGQQSAMMDCKT